LPAATLNIDCDAIEFPLRVNGHRRACLISVEVLRCYCGARRDGDMVAAYEQCQTELHCVARRIVEDGAAGDVLIATREFVRDRRALIVPWLTDRTDCSTARQSFSDT
jgi:hypothetical protein